MLPAKDPLWGQFSKFISPKSSTWKETKEKFVEWVLEDNLNHNNKVLSVSAVTKSTPSSPYIDNQEVLNDLKTFDGKHKLKVCLKCRKITNHLTEEHIPFR